jgi:preprotein translocase subunit SecA
MSRALSHSSRVDRVLRPFPERAEAVPGWHDRLAQSLYAHAVAPWPALVRQGSGGYRDILHTVREHEAGLHSLSDAELQQRLQDLRPQLRRQGHALQPVGACFAVLREASHRLLGRRHFDTQLMGAWALLQGRLVEMATGEGKTLTAALAACTAALAGQPVHVVTVNDYLAHRDAEEMAPLYRFAGLSVGCVVQGMSPQARREAYAQPLTYCTNKELAFDYLRDRVALGDREGSLHLALEKIGGAAQQRLLVMRGLHFAIVDEADSVFIDEARTPLILSASGPQGETADNCRRALELAELLELHEDFRLDARTRQVRLCPQAIDKVDAFAEPLGGVWTSRRGREELVRQALSALHLFHRDEHYVVADGKVQIVDESTGRILPDRSWERGLHQMIETKEGCEPTSERKTLARITYQRLFQRYLLLSGMSGTAREVAPEIRAVYGLDVAVIPLHRPSARRHEAPRLFATPADKWQAVADAAAGLAQRQGRPVLIGTRSVKASETISAVLTARGLPHALLNAKQDQFEAAVIALAGQAGRITVATNMAGRGTDIRLSPDTLSPGGLHVILTEYHESARIDRQLYGRCGRQGDPGSCSVFVSLEDEIFSLHAPWARAWVDTWLRQGRALPTWAIDGLRRLAQWQAERKNAGIRRQNLKVDRQLDQVLSFSGRQP